jgi:hypothetical protein
MQIDDFNDGWVGWKDGIMVEQNKGFEGSMRYDGFE